MSAVIHWPNQLVDIGVVNTYWMSDIMSTQKKKKVDSIAHLITFFNFFVLFL